VKILYLPLYLMTFLSTSVFQLIGMQGGFEKLHMNSDIKSIHGLTILLCESLEFKQHLEKLSELNVKCSEEESLSKSTVEFIKSYEETNRKCIENITNKPTSMGIFVVISRCTDAVASFVEELQQKAEKEPVVRDYMLHYYATFGKLGLINMRTNYAFNNLPKNIKREIIGPFTKQ
jgi:hypothetical protein